MIEAMGPGELAQHVAVCIVALGALLVVVRRVFGVFGTRPTTPTPGPGVAAHTCSHCAAGAAAQAKPGSPRI